MCRRLRSVHALDPAAARLLAVPVPPAVPVRVLLVRPAQYARRGVGAVFLTQQIGRAREGRHSLGLSFRSSASASSPACSTDAARTRKQVSAPSGPPVNGFSESLPQRMTSYSFIGCCAPNKGPNQCNVRPHRH